MQATNLFIVFLLVNLFFACQLSEDSNITPISPDTPEPEAIPKIKEEMLDDGTVGKYFYNEKGQLIESNWSDGTKVLYTYSSGLVEIQTYNDEGTLTRVQSLALNDEGLQEHYSESGSPFTYSFEYDSLGRHVHTTSRLADGSLFFQSYQFYNTEGNMVKDSTYRYIEKEWRVYQYEYFTEISNTVAQKNFGITFRGEGSKNCRKRELYTSSHGEHKVRDYLLPLLDTQDRILKYTITFTRPDGTLGTYWYAYTYY